MTAKTKQIICTLSDTAMAAQGLEWTDLSTLALSSRRIEGGVASTYPLELTDKIQDLAQREVSCCGSWLDVAVNPGSETLELQLTTTNPDGLPIILAMSGYSA